MTELDDISYSREECIAVIRDYYSFLTKMYLREEDVLHPPEGGWPSITPEIMAGLGKTDEVISLLRRLPYIRKSYSHDSPQAAGSSYFANWQYECHLVMYKSGTGGDLKLVSETAELHDDVPPHVISLTLGSHNNHTFLLDTELGIVYWHQCPGEIHMNTTREQVWDDPHEWAPENEADWRGDAARWSVKDFFELLKDQFIALTFIPINSQTVHEVYARRHPSYDGWIERVQAIYRHHGWPDLENFCKDECLEDIKTALTEEFPGFI
ncbi:hypothetical protein LY78DRAFT_659871 [Colletotrichum sublineola]|uniref:Uncharacterized protein n=1 Tax=Colletotrichum sublineola TaxID=1173701 RepID=A0A066X8G3_COLSU|nr:hypothetical protein LY78DRAFT_659871 [Colletotrichum sublineola]KDN65453.1 hypothetical protein CSUB01_03952 [Colletotrichum sublineola]